MTVNDTITNAIAMPTQLSHSVRLASEVYPTNMLEL